MQALHKSEQYAIENTSSVSECVESSLTTHFEKLRNYVEKLSIKDDVSAQEHEAVIVRLTHELGRAALSTLLRHYDISSDSISSQQQTYRRKHRAPKTYQTAFGSVEVTRTVYVNRKKDGDGKSVCPLELQAGIIEGYWTPLAAKNASWALAHLNSREVEDLLLQFGKMNPSRSSLDRLPKALLKQWEPQTIEQHQKMMKNEDVPANASTVCVSLDGVMVGMKPQASDDEKSKGRTCEWREASCGTISFFDDAGERISTIQYGRMPEHKKVTLKQLLKNNIEVILNKRPELNVVHVADGAQDNWCFFDEQMPLGFQLTDYYHACQYLKAAFAAAYPKQPEKAVWKFNEYKKILKDDANGISKTLRALRYLRQKHKNNADINKAVTYFTNNQHRMKYAEAKANNYPIGSGIVEAACKTLVGQRLKRSGMSWSLHGGQSILTLRSLVKSGRFDKAWNNIAQQYKTKVKDHQNIVNLFD